jgi:hypothetical protein
MIEIAPDLERAEKLDFVPVIFANGVDDDLPGLVATMQRERFQFEDRVYNPKDGDICFIEDKPLVISKPFHPLDGISENDAVRIFFEEMFGVETYAEFVDDVVLSISRCSIKFG